MSYFKVGDRVEVIVSEDSSVNPNINKGMLGTVVGIDDAEPNVGVQFDTYIQGHAANGKGKNGFCWFMYEYDLKKIETKGEDTNE